MRADFLRTYLERDIPALGPRIPTTTLRRFWTMLAHVPPEKMQSFLYPQYVAWRDALPSFIRGRCHDFGFWEHYLPNSLGARNYAGARAQLVNPFASREAMMLVIAMDPALRRSGAVNRAILDRVAPDLDDIPFV